MFCRTPRAHGDRDGTRANLWTGALGLVVFGAGLGLFIAPNNHATINTAPANISGVAGGLLNLTRILGTVAGVASASAMLSWHIQVARGSTERRLAPFAPHHFVEAVAAAFHARGLCGDRRSRFVDPENYSVALREKLAQEIIIHSLLPVISA